MGIAVGDGREAWVAYAYLVSFKASLKATETNGRIFPGPRGSSSLTNPKDDTGRVCGEATVLTSPFLMNGMGWER